jgi:hypothetical protein
VRAPRHESGRPETLTDTDYANPLRVPDRGSLADKCDYALFVRFGRRAHEDSVALSAGVVYRAVSRRALAVGIPGRLAHPHARWRGCWATHWVEAGVPVREVSARFGRVALYTTACYAARRDERVDSDRRHFWAAVARLAAETVSEPGSARGGERRPGSRSVTD